MTTKWRGQFGPYGTFSGYSPAERTALWRVLAHEDGNAYQKKRVEEIPSGLMFDVMAPQTTIIVGIDIDSMLEILTERQRLVITKRFGLDGGDERTLQEIGDMIGTTREYIRQVECHSIRKLKKAFNRATMPQDDSGVSGQGRDAER